MSDYAFRPDQERKDPKPLFDCLEQAIRAAIHCGTDLSDVRFDTWAMKEIRKWRRLETHTQQERATLLELYAKALGVTVADPEILKAA